MILFFVNVTGLIPMRLHIGSLGDASTPNFEGGGGGTHLGRASLVIAVVKKWPL